MLSYWLEYGNYDILVFNKDIDNTIDVIQKNGIPKSIDIERGGKVALFKRMIERGFKVEAKLLKKVVS